MTQQDQTVKSMCAALAALLLSSCNSPKSIPGIQDFNIGVQKNHLYAGFVAQMINIDAGLTMPIPGLTGATIGVTPYLDTTGNGQTGTTFQFDVDLTQLQGQNYAVAGLPDNRPIPDVQGGVLPRWKFSIQNIDVYLYLADGAFAIFVPVNLTTPQGYTLPTILSQEIDDERGNMIGKAYAIPTQGAGTVSGVLILLPYINPGISN